MPARLSIVWAAALPSKVCCGTVLESTAGRGCSEKAAMISTTAKGSSVTR